MLQTLCQPSWSQDRPSREQAFQAMHANTTNNDPGFITRMRTSIKEHYTARNCDVSIATWSLTNYALQHTPESPLINVVLQELFPVLEGASICDYARTTSFVPPGSNVTHMHVPFDTVMHGNVILASAGVEQGCRMEIIKTDVEGHATACHCLRGYPQKTKQISHCSIFISLIHQRSGCQACGKDDPAKLLRCSRCWEKLRAPVWYCSAQCQAADYPRHKQVCGKINV